MKECDSIKEKREKSIKEKFQKCEITLSSKFIKWI